MPAVHKGFKCGKRLESEVLIREERHPIHERIEKEDSPLCTSSIPSTIKVEESL
jgi:hypothetical protein